MMFPRIGRHRNSKKNDADGKIEKTQKRRSFLGRPEPVEALLNPERRRSSDVVAFLKAHNLDSKASDNDSDHEDDVPLMMESALSNNDIKSKAQSVQDVKSNASSLQEVKSNASSLQHMGSASSSEGSKTLTRSHPRPQLQRPSPASVLSLSGGGLVMSALHRFRKPLVRQGRVFPAHISMPTRRALEIEIMQNMDRLVINKNVGEFWFLMDSIWTSRWVEFVMGTAGPPGPITNSNLFLQEGEDPRSSRTLGGQVSTRFLADSSGEGSFRSAHALVPGLKKLTDYRVVHPMVWYIFREIYDTDGSPEICRWNTDLYSDPVQPARKMRVEEDSRIKAVYQLRKFLNRVNNGPSATSA